MALEDGNSISVGVNMFVEEDEQTRVPTHRVNPSIEREQCQRLAALRSRRNNQIVNQLTDQLASAAQSDDNLMPLLITCVESDMTLGEICNTLRNVWGEYRPEQSI
jgi:methylmalonyl-CoA mutase N-terminal domain/subunit